MTAYARFCVQVKSNHALHEIMIDRALTPASSRSLPVGQNQCVPDLPPAVHAEQTAMTSHVITQMRVEGERPLAVGTPIHQPSWEDLASSLIAVIVGLWHPR
jgi:hypothetical protein